MRQWDHKLETYDGRTRKAFRVVCCKCGTTDAIHVLFGRDNAADLLPKKFTARGWSIGKRPDADRCLSCVMEERKIKSAKVVQMSEVRPLPAPPREPTRADLRKIQDALNDAYPVPERGYSQGFSDDVLAKKLDVPRAWVTRVRDQFCGPEIIVDTARLEREVNELKRSLKSIEDATLATLTAHGQRVEVMIKQLEALKSQLKGAG